MFVGGPGTPILAQGARTKYTTFDSHPIIS